MKWNNAAGIAAPSDEGGKGASEEREFMNQEKLIFALGFFDGVHLGHQALLKACVELAGEQNMKTAAITFEAHPQSLFSDSVPLLLTTLADRNRLLRHYGITQIHAYAVDKKVMSTNWRDFLDELVERGAAGFVCGDDFRFGNRGEGSGLLLRQYCDEKGLPCVLVPEQDLDGIRVSSTHIRSLMEAGEMERAVAFLGHPHILTGEVVPGRQLGRTIGVPTANLLIPEGVLVPKRGVYCCKAVVDGMRYLAVTNIGSRPTVNGHQVRAEAWLLDFSGDLYGKRITLEFYKFLRPEQKFASLEELKTRIGLDGEKTKNFFLGEPG